MKIFLIIIRLIIYYIAVSAPAASPAVAAGYDAAGLVLWFIIVPLESVLAFTAAYRMFRPADISGKVITAVENKKTFRIIISAFLLPVLFLPVPGFSGVFFKALILAFIILVLNILIFRFKFISLSFVEPFFIFFIYYRLLEFSRSSESASEMSEAVIPLFFVLLVLSYLIMSMLLYYSSGSGGFKDIKKEAAVLVMILIPVLVTLAVLKPADYIITDFIFNFRDEKALTGGGGSDEENNSDGLENGVSGVPSDRWGNRSRGSSGSGKQYAVMIAASKEKTLYSAWEYLEILDPVKGFHIHPEQTLNRLKKQRFLETWTNPDTDSRFMNTEKRKKAEAFFISTTGDRVVPFIPYIIEPTIYGTETYPFSYSYNSVSFISIAGLQVLSRTDIKDLADDEKAYFSEYLEADLSDQYRKIFTDFIAGRQLDALPYNKRITALLESFSTYQYELGFDEDMSVEKLSRFIEGRFPGDCSEFSNAAAILGRLLGIPSRVVLGYLASEDLQTPNHKIALDMLKQSIKRISAIPLENLKLVTTAHKHSWVQFYVPGYGWTDFEATEFAIPPEGGDPNAGQIVIPIIKELSHQGREYIFPWKLLLSVFIMILISAVMLLYLYKALKLAFLIIMQKYSGNDNISYKYRYILHRFFLSGYPLKKKTMTPCQYGEINSSASSLAEIYTELLYRENYTGEDKENTLIRFDAEYRKLLVLTRPENIKKMLKYIFSLRGIFY